MPKIFLSHSSKDKKFARRLARDLQTTGVSVWIDEAEMFVGDSLIRKLEHAIRNTDFLGVILTPDSIKSEWVQREVEIALNHEIKGKKIKVLPIFYKDCEVPGFLSGKVWADFRGKQSYKSGLAALLKRFIHLNDKVDVPQLNITDQQTDKFCVINWNIGGRNFLELPEETRFDLRSQLNKELTYLVKNYQPDVVTLQEIVRYKNPHNVVVAELLDPIDGYSYLPVTLVDNTTISNKAKWEKIRKQGNWPSETSFEQGIAFLIKDNAPMFGVWDLDKNQSNSIKPDNRHLAIEKIDLQSGLYFGDRDSESRAALVSHFIFGPKCKNKCISSEKLPLDIFVVNAQLSALTGEREGLPMIEANASTKRMKQLELIIIDIVSRYNAWRQKGYPLQGRKNLPTKNETFNRHTPIWILSGAFNFTEHSEEYEFVRRMNFADAIPSKNVPTKANGLGKAPVLSLDHIFMGPSMMSMDRVFSDEVFLRNRVDTLPKGSDHYPLVAWISL